MHGVRKGDNSLEGNKWRKKERERVIRVEHGKRALISQLYWRKKRVRPAWTSIVGRRPLLSLCIIAFRSYRLERDKIQVSHDIIKKQLPLRVGGGSPLEWLGEKISRRLTHPVRRPIVLGAFVWLPISLRAVPWKNYSWRGYLRKRHFRQKITITQNATNWAIRCHRPPDQEKFSCEFQLTATQRRQDVNDFQFSSSFFSSLSFTIMIIMMSEKGEFVVDPFTTGLIGWSVHIAIMSWVSVEQDAQLSIYSSLSLIARYHIRWEFCGKVSPSSLKERLAWACQWFFDVPSPSEVGGKKAPGTDNNRKKKKKYNTYNSYI